MNSVRKRLLIDHLEILELVYRSPVSMKQFGTDL